MIRAQSYSYLSEEAQVAAAEAANSAAAAAASALAADASADLAEASAILAQNASDGLDAALDAVTLAYYSFEFKTDMEAITPAADGVSATVWGDSETNNGVYGWDATGGVWNYMAPNVNQRVSTLESGFGVFPLGTTPAASALVVVNEGGWVVAMLTSDVIETLVGSQTWLDEMPAKLIIAPTNGKFLKMNEGGWVERDYDQAATTESADADEADRVASFRPVSLLDAPLIDGKNISFTWGESKGENIGGHGAFEEIYEDVEGTTLPVGITIGSGIYWDGGEDIDELIGLAGAMRSAMDDAFTAGAEVVSVIYLIAQRNDMLRFLPPDDWEASVLTATDIVRRAALQRYVGTDPDVPVPVPPVFAIVDTTWDNGDVPPDIPLHCIDMAQRIPWFGIATADYICEFSNPDYTHWSVTDQKLISAYLDLAWFYSSVNNEKYEPTQVVEHWLEDNDVYLRFKMPHAPLVSDTALVSTIADWGLVAYPAAGGTTTISGLEIVGGGTIVKFTPGASLEGGGRVELAMHATTASTSGKATGPRSTLRDSSPYTVDLGGGDVRNLYSAALPGRFYF